MTMNISSDPIAPSSPREAEDASTISSDLDCSQFTFGAYVVVFGAMFVFGTVGNWLSWAVLRWDRRSSGRVATFLLQTMAVVDNLFLLTAFISHFTSALTVYVESASADGDRNNSTAELPATGFGFDFDSHRSRGEGESTSDGFGSDSGRELFAFRRNDTEFESEPANISTGFGFDFENESENELLIRAQTPPPPPTSVYFSAYVNSLVTVCVWPLVHVTQMWAVWITVLVAFNRYVAICRPFQAPKLCTMRQTRLQALVLAAAAVVYNVPRLLEHRIEYKPVEEYNGYAMPTIVQTELKISELYVIVYENFLYCLFVFLGPLLVLIVLNTCLVRELLRARRRLRDRRLPASVTGGEAGDDQGEQNLTLVMIVIILIFVVCQSPAFANQILFALIGETQYACGRVYFYYYHISNLLVTANSSVNFVVYCVFRRQFRRRLYACCCRSRLLNKHRMRSPSTELYPLYATQTAAGHPQRPGGGHAGRSQQALKTHQKNGFHTRV